MRLFKYDPRQPIASLSFHIKCLRFCGLWMPDDPSKKKHYKVFAAFMLTAFLYFFVFTEILHFFGIHGIPDFAASLCFFLIQVVLIIKLFFFLKYGDRVKGCIEKLESPLFRAQNEEEDEFVGFGIFRCLFFHRSQLFLAYACIIMWAVTPFFPSSGKLYLVPAKFPWPAHHGLGYAIAYMYQIISISHSAYAQFSVDTLMTGLMYQGAVQCHLLGVRLAKIGHEGHRIINVLPVQDRNASPSQAYRELLTCIKHYEEIMEYTTEFQSIFKQTIFLQLGLTLFVLCMTEVILMNFGSVLLFLNIFPYFLVITFQIWQICSTGNEVLFASKTLMQRAYFSNYLSFDVKTRKLLIMFMERLKRDVVVEAGVLFKLTLNIDTFTSIMRASYSYFALLQSVQNKKINVPDIQ